MFRSGTLPLRLLMGISTVIAVALPVSSASAQTTTQVPASTTLMSIDAPLDQTMVSDGVQVDIGGWTVDTAGSANSGIDEVRVYLDGQMDSGGRMLGKATYPKPRPDVGQSLNNPNFSQSGFDLVWTPSGLNGGSHTIYVYAHSSLRNAWSYKSVTVTASGIPSGSTGGNYGPGGYRDRGYGDSGMYGSGMYGNDMYGQGGMGQGGMGQGGMMPPPPPPPPPPPIFLIPPPVAGVGATAIPAPTGVVATAVTGTTVTLTWAPSVGATQYRVIVSVNGGPF